MDFKYVEMWIVFIIAIVVQVEGDKIHSYHFKVLYLEILGGIGLNIDIQNL
jgi:hypothetical protein